MVNFIAKHPNIGAAVGFHTHSGVILRPMGTQSDSDMTPEDLWMIKRISDIGSKLTGYPAVSIFHDFKYHPKEVITGTQDWVYEHLGALFWTVEVQARTKKLASPITTGFIGTAITHRKTTSSCSNGATKSAAARHTSIGIPTSIPT